MDLLAWLEQAKLIDPSDAAAIRANSFPGELDEVAAQARALREWFRVRGQSVRAFISR